MNRRKLCLLVACTLLGLNTFAHAQGYPERAVKIVVPFGAGGITDVAARLVADKMAITLKQAVYIENKPGMGGALGPATVASAPADGYTLLFGGTGNSIGQTLYGKKLTYDLSKDFAAISRVAEAINVLCVNPNVPAKTVAELVALTKSKPDQLLYASSGNGSLYHLAFELFKYMTDTQVRHIPYKTESAQRTDVIAGRVDMMIDAYGVVKSAVEGGQLRLLATTSAKRFNAIGNIPTLAESGLPGYEADAWVGLLAPAGTPAPVIAKIHQAVIKALGEADVQAKFAEQGLVTIGDTPQQAAEFINKDIARWKEIIERAGVSVQ